MHGHADTGWQPPANCRNCVAANFIRAVYPGFGVPPHALGTVARSTPPRPRFFALVAAQQPLVVAIHQLL